AGGGAAESETLQRGAAGPLRAATHAGDRTQHAPDRWRRLHRGAGLNASTPAVSATMRAMDHDQLTVVVAAKDEADALPLLHARLARVLDALEAERVAGRILYVDDGSRDGTWDVMRGLANGDRRVALLRLSRNFGKEAALTAGLDHVVEGAAIILDADGQDP